MSRKFFGTWLMLCWLFLPVWAVEFGSVTIEELPSMLPHPPSNGYFDGRLRIENRSVAPAAIRLTLRPSFAGREYLVRRDLLVPPGSVQQVSLYYPLMDETDWQFYQRLELMINGKSYENKLLQGSAGYLNEGCLVSGSLPLEQYQSLFQLESRQVSDIPVAQWGTTLHDYAGVRQVWVSSEDRLPLAVAAVLDRWVFAGGALFVCVLPDAPWPEGVPSGVNGCFVQKIGSGVKIFCRPVAKEKEQEVKAFLEKKEGVLILAGMKIQFVSNSGHSPFGSEESELEITVADEDSPAPTLATLMHDFGMPELKSGSSMLFEEMKLPQGQLPLRWLIGGMILFVLVIGPVNYFWLRYRRREVWVLITTPVISLVFCFLVIGFLSFHEGWRSDSRAWGVTLLDQTARLAATRAWNGFYGPFSPRDGFRFAADDVLFCRHGGSFQLVENQGQIFSASLAEPRVPLLYQLLRVESRREELKVLPLPNGELEVINGLGGELKTLRVVDADGRIHRSAGTVPAGARLRLEVTGERTRSNASVLNGLFGVNPLEKPEQYLAQLPAGYYLATADRALFFSPGVKADREEARQVIIGKFNLVEGR